jgi:Ni/Co efflux regulator RcnB
MKTRIALLSLATSLSGLFVILQSAEAAPYFEDQRDRDRRDHDNIHDSDRDRRDFHFRPEHERALRSHYSGPKQIPQKYRHHEFSRDRHLPPGWQSRIRPVPVAAYRELPPIPANCSVGYLDGYAVVYDKRSQVIVDALRLIGDLAR